MEKDTNKTGRQNYQVTPFTYEDQTIRTVMIDGNPWFSAKDVGNVLGIVEARSSLRDFPESERRLTTMHTLGGDQEMVVVNEPGMYRLIFQSRKPEAEKFKTWVFSEVLPQIRKTGNYGTPEHEGDACAGQIYRLFSGCHDMTIQRINKVIYYFAVNPPLMNMDIAKLLDVSDGIISLWRKRLTSEMAQNAVAALGINAMGIASGQATALPSAHPAKEAQDEQA